MDAVVVSATILTEEDGNEMFQVCETFYGRNIRFREPIVYYNEEPIDGLLRGKEADRGNRLVCVGIMLTSEVIEVVVRDYQAEHRRLGIVGLTI